MKRPAAADDLHMVIDYMPRKNVAFVASPVGAVPSIVITKLQYHTFKKIIKRISCYWLITPVFIIIIENQ